MTSKTSLFKKGLIISDLKRFWWISALYTVILLFIMPLNHLMRGNTDSEWAQEMLRLSLYLQDQNPNLQRLLICIIPVLTAVLLFRYMQSGNSAALVHSLPLNRKVLFVNHSAVGLALISIPVILNGLILMLIQSTTVLGDYYSLTRVMQWIILTLLLNFFFYAFAIFVGMFTGSSIAHLAFNYILQIVPIGIFVLMESILPKLFYGFGDQGFTYGFANDVPIIRLFSNIRDSGAFLYHYTLPYLIAAVLFFAAAGLIYRMRKLEAAGDIIAFSLVRPVFKYGVAICSMLVGGGYFGGVSDGSFAMILLGSLLASFLGYWIAEILLHKSFKVWKAYKGYLVFTALLLLVFAGIRADLFGFVHRIPGAQDVKKVYIGYSLNAWTHLEKLKDGTIGDENYAGGYFLYKEENIQSAINLHKALVDGKNASAEGPRQYIIYTLKNGKHLIRQYIFDYEKYASQLKPIFESMEYKETTFPVLSQKPEDIKMVEITDYRSLKKHVLLNSREEIRDFVKLLQEEMKKSTFEDLTGGTQFISIQLMGLHENTLRYYSVPRSYISVIQWLKDKGYYNQCVLLPEDVESIILEKDNRQYSASESGIPPKPNTVEIKDRKVIEELLELSLPHGFKSRDEIISYGIKLKDTTNQNVYKNFFTTNFKMSEDLRNYINQLK